MKQAQDEFNESKDDEKQVYSINEVLNQYLEKTPTFLQDISSFVTYIQENYNLVKK
jgi:hypothetical protein